MYSNVLEYNRSFCLAESESSAFLIILSGINYLKANCGPKKEKELEMVEMKYTDLGKKIFPTKNTCIPIERVCIEDVRSFMETQTKKNLSEVSWNDLTKNPYLDSFKIDSSFNPCVVFVWYKKIFNDEISKKKLLDIVINVYAFTLMPFCSRKSIQCMEKVYTWDNISY